MPRKKSRISDEVKASVLSATAFPGCNITKIAKAYNISKTTIYSWIREKSSAFISSSPQIPADQTCTSSARNNITGSSSEFLELSILDSTPISTSALRPRSTLEKALLTFHDCSITIEGKVKSSSLIAIIQILENQSC